MERSMGEYIKKLIELDTKAVELTERRQKEINELQLTYDAELENYKKQLLKAEEAGRSKRDEIMAAAAREIDRIKTENSKKLKAIEDSFAQRKNALCDEIWSAIMMDFAR